MLACEHGGMNESLAELYARTGNQKYLRLSRRFHHKAVLEPFARREDRLQGMHANTQIPKLIGLARRYELTLDETDKTAAEFFGSVSPITILTSQVVIAMPNTSARQTTSTTDLAQTRPI